MDDGRIKTVTLVTIAGMGLCVSPEHELPSPAKAEAFAPKVAMNQPARKPAECGRAPLIWVEEKRCSAPDRVSLQYAIYHFLGKPRVVQGMRGCLLPVTSNCRRGIVLGLCGSDLRTAAFPEQLVSGTKGYSHNGGVATFGGQAMSNSVLNDDQNESG